jgi:antitoxin component of MazEF toxin-antitoxin module
MHAHRFTTKLAVSSNRLWSAHVVIPATITKKIAATGSRRVVCTLNGAATFTCALVAYRRGEWVVTVNRTLQRTLGLSISDKVRVSLINDPSEYGHEMPAEFAESLKQDPEARTLFKVLTLGRQRTLLYIVNAVRDPAKRALRSAVILRHLRQNDGDLRYRQLAEQLRSSTKRP